MEQSKESSTDEWVSEMLPVSIQWSISSSIKRNEVYIDRCSNMDEPWKHAKWKKPVTKDSIQYDFIHMKYPEQAIYREKCISISRIWVCTCMAWEENSY